MFFLNPFAMVVGGALVSAPILIHLINRMRFKRIRWAAMEFLLKSQKRNRRRLIIEQLILLMLRCLLVLLAGFLVARFVGEALGVTSSSSTTHVVVLDDTLSMTDRAPKNQSPGPNCFDFARQQVRTLAENAVQAPSAQNLIVMTASKNQVIFTDRLNDESVGRLKAVLNDLKPTAMHIDVADAVEAGKKQLGEAKDSKRWLHVISDFREQDWARKPGTEKLHQALNEVADTGAQVALVDTSAPSRSVSRAKVLDFHNNFAITELRAEKRIAPSGTIVPFTVEVHNYGTEAAKTIKIDVFHDGKEDLSASKVYDAPSPGSSIRHTFDMLFTAPGMGQRSKFHRITARLNAVDPESGLLADNVRHAVIEVRENVPSLVIDGGLAGDGRSPPSGSDARVIKDILESIKGTEAAQVVVKTSVAALLDADLEREYSTIYLLNVSTLEYRDNDKAKEAKLKDQPLARLRQFVQNGGNVVFFTGDKIDEKYYNTTLFEGAQGLFPVPIEKAKTDRLSVDDLEKVRANPAPKIFVVDPGHEITRALSAEQYFMSDLLIAQHTPAKERFEWKTPRWVKEGDLKELIVMAKLRSLDDASRGSANRLLVRLDSAAKNAANKKYKDLLEKHSGLILKVVENGGANDMHKLTQAMDALINERGDPRQKDNVSLQDFWALPEQKELKADFVDYREKALYGAPLMLTRKYGNGNVVAFLTTAGTAWSGWPALGGALGGVASRTYPMLIADLQKFLTRGGDAGNRLIGERISFELDPAQYKDEVKRFIQEDEGETDPGRVATDAPPGLSPEPIRKVTPEDGKLKFVFETAVKPGVHCFRLFPQAAPAGADPLTPDANVPAYEERWYAFNVDTKSESNLRRVASDEVIRNPTDAPPTRGKMRWVESGYEELQSILREKKSDASESPWLYLIILIVLIAEQALAVHLSFHLKGGDASAAGTAAAATTATPRQQARAAAAETAGV